MNFIIGENGQGKTAILEALAYLSSLRSFRGAKNDEIIRYGEEFAEAWARIRSREWTNEMKVAFAEAAGGRAAKTAFIDGKPVRSSTQYLSSRFGQAEVGFHSIVFNPSDHDLIRGDPATRRSYLDRTLSAESPAYLRLLSRYQKTLEQRNALLKDERRPAPELLEGFTASLVEAGAAIARTRVEWFSRLQDRLSRMLAEIVAHPLALHATYVSNWIKKNDGISISSASTGPLQFPLQSPLPSLEFFEVEFREALQANREAEWRAGVTLVGPHRDDFTLFYGPQPLRGHGSQGETRSALIALKLCEIALFRERTGHRPILLLDDFSSELDRGRREFLLRFLTGTDLQVFVTSTEEPPGAGRVFHMRSGRLE